MMKIGYPIERTLNLLVITYWYEKRGAIMEVLKAKVNY